MNRITEITEFGVEHLLGMTYGPLVKLATVDNQGNRTLTHIDPATARKLAADLFNAVARSEYEADLHTTMTKHGIDDGAKAAILHMVREGEEIRLSPNE